VRCWGGNYAGQLGNGSDTDATKPVPIAKVGNATSLNLTSSGGCVATGDKTASCWGANNTGYIVPNEDGSTTYVRTPVDAGITDVKQAAIGGYTLCVLTDTTNSVQCRGARFYGMLGDGESGIIEPSKTFVSVKGIIGKPTQLAMGYRHTCATAESKNVFCWGNGAYGQNGSPTDADLLQATPVDGVTDVVGLISSDRISCAIQEGGAVQCWGSNLRGLLGRGPQFTADHSGAPGFVVGLSDVKKVASGHSALHACGIKNDGTLWCWGSNNEGELGKSCGESECQGDEGAKFVSSPVQSQVTGAIDAAAGYGFNTGGFTCALLNDHSVHCWGANKYGQLGIGRTSDVERTPQRVVWK
jgi:alpha-tubulin suppressor-like RCC1 family protein